MDFAADGSPRWQSVTAELHSSTLPLTQWFRAMLPHRDAVFSSFRSTVKGPCIEPPQETSGATAGSAFDFLVRCMLGSRIGSDPVVDCIFGYCPSRRWMDVALELVTSVDALIGENSNQLTTDVPREELIRGCWAVALFVELVRGVPFGRSALARLGDAPSHSGLLALAPSAALHDLLALQNVYSTHLQPLVDARYGELFTGPAFSCTLPGDADFIKGTTLFEVKAMVHRRRRDGTPRYSLDSRMIYQVLAYSLLAQRDFGIDEVVIFNARYAHVYTWRLPTLLENMAGAPTDAVTLAAELDLFLSNPFDPRVPPAAREAAERVLAGR